MYEKCANCDRLGDDCFPNLYIMDAAEIREWQKQRMKYKGWTQADLSAVSGVPKGTISYTLSKKDSDISYTTFSPMFCALVGGERTESPCPDPPADVTLLEDKITQLEQENEALKTQASHAEDAHRNTIDDLKQDLQFSRDQILDKDAQIHQKDQRYANLEKRNRRLNLALYIILGVLLVYLLVFDLPNPEYGVLRFKSFVDAVKSAFSSPGCGVVSSVMRAMWGM